MQKNNAHTFIDHIKRLPCEPSQSPSSAPSLSEQEIQHLQDADIETDSESDRAILEFKRQIEERFKISVANKIYSFPKRVQSVEDLISSDENSDEDEGQNNNDDAQEALRPISKVQTINRQLLPDKKYVKEKEKQREVKEKEKEKDKQKDKVKGFKKKEVYYVRESSGIKPTNEQVNNDTKGQKQTKKSGKSKQRDRKQQLRETNRSKRMNTEPDSYNYLQTLRNKNKR